MVEELVLLNVITNKQQEIALNNLDEANRAAFVFRRQDGLVAVLFVGTQLWSLYAS